MKSIVCLIAAFAGIGASAQLIVGNDQSTGANIYAIDVTSGAATVLFTPTSAQKPWGMAADNVNNILYWNNGGNLYSASYSSLLAGTAAPTPLAMTFNSASVNFVGLAYNPNTGMLLGTRNIATEAVYEINPLTGVATQIYVYSSSYDFGGLDYDGGRLYGLTDAAPAGSVRGLYEIGLPAGPETFIHGYPGSETDIDGLAVGGGRAYMVSDGPNTTQANFYVIDLASQTQVGTLPSPFTGSGTFSAGAYAPGLVPEPGTFLALGVGAMVLLAGYRRSRK